jgi:ABC-type phosphate transport system auxiliary subunit
MSELVFNEILLISQKEKKARKVEFDPRLTIILGKNRTGKSSLLKSIPRAFSAVPEINHDSWNKASVSCLVKFTIANQQYSILQYGDYYSLFDESNNLLLATDSVTKSLGPYLAGLFAFGLKLKPRNSEELISPPPAYFFLPYYIDQDSSWRKSWATFKSLGQLDKDWKKNLIDYHAGLRPNEYYDIIGKIGGIKENVTKQEAEKRTLTKLLAQANSKFQQINFDVDIAAFQKEIETLLEQCKRLQVIEELHKNKLIELYSKRSSIESQIKITEDALNEARADFGYATYKIPDEHVECPTCGATYENTFAERFAIAKDEERCTHLLFKLNYELMEVNKDIEAEKAKHNDSHKEVADIKKTLEYKQGQIRLKDLIENEGKKELLNVFETSINDAEKTIATLTADIEKLNEQLKKFRDRKRTAEIQTKFKDAMRLNCFQLDVSGTEKSYKNMTGTIAETGSCLPRALLAYYFSMLSVMREYSSSAFAPIIIDSPIQQAQDDINMPKIVQFIRDRQPDNTQVILGLEDLHGVKFDAAKVVTLTDKHSLLQTSQYDDVYSEITPLLEIALGTTK